MNNVGPLLNPPGALASDILAAVSTLERGSESVRAVMAAEENRFTRALVDLQRIAVAEGIPIAIVGGLGAIRYSYPAATQDIDIAIGAGDLDKLIHVAPGYGFKVASEAECGWHTLTHGDVEINVVPEGGTAQKNAPTTIPGPKHLGVSSGLGYASLPGWIELKLSSGRLEDRAHVVEVLKKSSPETIEEARQHVARVHQSHLALFDQLRKQALDELDQEKRGP